MGKGIWTEVDFVARKVKQPFIEVGNSLVHPECIMSTANSLIYTAGGRNYKKAYDGEALVCSCVDQDGWLSPMLISKNKNSATYYTDGDYSSGNLFPSFTVTFKGETWYVATGGAAYPNTIAITQTNVIHLNDLFTCSTKEEYALAFLNYVYTSSLVARKVKNGWVEVDNVARQFFSGSAGMLYDAGDEYNSLTGGWGAYFNPTSGWWSGYSTAGVRNADHMLLEWTGSTRQVKSVATTNKISTVGFTKLCVDADVITIGSNDLTIGFASNLNGTLEEIVRVGHGTGITGRKVTVMDGIPQGNYNVIVYSPTSGSSLKAKIYKVWLE